MAVPSPTQELARLDRLLRQGLPSVLVLSGSSDFFREQALARALAAIPTEAELRIVDAAELRDPGGGAAADEGDDDDAGDDEGDTAQGEGGGGVACPELLDLRGGGLFARTTFVVVKRGSNWWKRFGVAVQEQRGRFVAGSGLILEAHKLDKRKKAAAQLVRDLGEAGAMFEFRDLYDQPYDRARPPTEGELCKWVVLAAEKLGVRLTPEAAWLVVAEVGKAPAELVAELQRLRDQLGADPKRPPLGPRDLAGRLHTSFESDPFQFAEAVLAHDRVAATRSLAAIFARGVRSRDGRDRVDAGGVLPFTIHWLFQQLATLHEAHALREAGVSARDLPGRLGVRQFADRFVANFERNDRVVIERGLLALVDCQRATRLSGEEPEVLLERFLAQWFEGAPPLGAEEWEL